MMAQLGRRAMVEVRERLAEERLGPRRLHFTFLLGLGGELSVKLEGNGAVASRRLETRHEQLRLDVGKHAVGQPPQEKEVERAGIAAEQKRLEEERIAAE